MAQQPVFNLDQAEFFDWGNGDRFEAKIARLSPALGARKLGFNLVRLAPGKVAFPHHFHHANEELFLILEGTGKVRYADQEYPVREGDLVCCPPGPESAHQILNDSDRELRYLALSTTETPEAVEYPDSEKVAVLATGEPGGPPALRFIARRSDGVDYWEGE